ncbi:MAG: tRNA lysidine(34) synthetase TilS [Cyclobacteriaceae bacterium]|nr:tRNA lysidine(34) synthetase TilS [Cyclobacteriaceae bacterium]
MMLDDFLLFTGTHNLCQENDRVLLALSGGIDSMVMLDLFIRGGFKVGIAHCNFQLRGAESDGDELFVKNKSDEAKLPCYIRKFETQTYGREHRVSIQMAARDLRYAWFEELRSQHRYDRIATAHHLDDNIETLFFNLFKGTGLKGLAGIPVRQDHVIRPLLFAGKDQIVQYAGQHKIAFREDQSNLDIKYNRNLIRNKILPLVKAINPGFDRTIISTLERLNESQKLIEYWVAENKHRFLHQEGGHVYLDKSFLTGINSPVFLHEVLRTWGFNYDQCRDILARKEKRSGSLFYSDTHVLNIDRETMVISSNIIDRNTGYRWYEPNDDIETRFGKFRKETVSKEGALKSDDPHREYFDLTRLKFPLEIRLWKAGDRFIPLGMKGKKKLSDFMIDEKIPVNLKQRMPVILSEGSVIWFVGQRIDERFKIMPDSLQILKITFEPIHDQSV